MKQRITQDKISLITKSKWVNIRDSEVRKGLKKDVGLDPGFKGSVGGWGEISRCDKLIKTSKEGLRRTDCGTVKISLIKQH